MKMLNAETLKKDSLHRLNLWGIYCACQRLHSQCTHCTCTYIMLIYKFTFGMSRESPQIPFWILILICQHAPFIWPNTCTMRSSQWLITWTWNALIELLSIFALVLEETHRKEKTVCIGCVGVEQPKKIKNFFVGRYLLFLLQFGPNR